MNKEELKQAEIERVNEVQKAVRAEQESYEIERVERAEIDRREEQKELDRKEADRKEQDDKYYREKADRERAEADRREEQKRAERKEQERHRQEPKPNPIKEKRQVVEYYEHWQDVKGDKPTEANRNFIYTQYAHAIERAETPQELKEALARSGISMKRSEQDPRVYQYTYKGTQAESLSYLTDKKVYANRPQEIKESIKVIKPPKKQLLER